ncbi:hypothetical protein MSAN_01771400 [Mycena sanguinolenta]|uniref:Uncharacterized protein n=1 Tax=Mycena sanguinolenta TaxID=230812 RepID=A0A8H6XXR5_9AGAR|nr:hypothetical protein MSAN_01771400 [Mycena sanguinolenta]
MLRRRLGLGLGRPEHAPLLTPSTSVDPGVDAAILVVPIHERLVAADPQAASPLYNGRIPPEIRNILFAAILAEFTIPDPSRAYPPEISRPGFTGPFTMNVALLLTCRRIYLETYHLPPQLATHVFWHGPSRGPPDLRIRFSNDQGHWPERHYFLRLTPWQHRFVKEIKLFTQMYWLDGAFPIICANGDIPVALERLKITLRKGDWWYNERNHPFFVNPHRGGHLEQYREDIAREECGQTIPWASSGWGTALQRLPALQELEVEFETSVDRKEELKLVVQRALRWRFPMANRGVLSNKGLGMALHEWQSESESFCVFTVKWKLVENTK